VILIFLSLPVLALRLGSDPDKTEDEINGPPSRD